MYTYTVEEPEDDLFDDSSITTSFDETNSALFKVFVKVLERVSRGSWLPDVAALTEPSLL